MVQFSITKCPVAGNSLYQISPSEFFCVILILRVVRRLLIWPSVTNVKGSDKRRPSSTLTGMIFPYVDLLTIINVQCRVVELIGARRRNPPSEINSLTESFYDWTLKI